MIPDLQPSDLPHMPRKYLCHVENVRLHHGSGFLAELRILDDERKGDVFYVQVPYQHELFGLAGAYFSAGKQVLLSFMPSYSAGGEILDLSETPETLLNVEYVRKVEDISHPECYPWTTDTWNAFVSRLDIADEIKLEMEKPKHFH